MADGAAGKQCNGFHYTEIYRHPAPALLWVYTISFPPEPAQRAEGLAKRDSRTMSEVFREAFGAYYAQQARKTLEEIGEYAEGRNPGRCSDADVARLIKEVRSQESSRGQVRARR